jgi:hypothetical protein
VAKGMRVTSATGKATMGLFTISGLMLKPPFPPLLQAGGSLAPPDVDAILGALTLDKATIEDADVQMLDGVKPHATIHRLEFNGIAPGKVGAAHTETLQVIDEAGSDMQLGALDLTNLAYPAGTGTPAEFLAAFAFDKASLQDFDFKLMQAGTTHLMSRRLEITGVAPGTVGSAHGEGLGVVGRDGTDIHVGGLDLVKLGYDPAAIDQPETLLQSLAVEKASIEDSDIELPQQSGQPHLSLHRFELDSMAPGAVAGGRIETLGLTTDGIRVHLGLMRLGNLAYRLRSASDKDAADAFSPLRGLFIESFGIEDASGSASDGFGIALASYESTMKGSIDMATGFDMTLKQLSVDLSQVKDLPGGFAIEELGTSTLVLNADAHTTYDPRSKVMDIPRYAFEVPKLGSLTLKARFGNFIADSAGDPTVILDRLMAATLQRLEIRYDDDSLVSHVMAIAAKEDSETVEQVRASVIALLLGERASLGRDPAAVKMLDTLIAFVRQPKSITIAIEPKPPLPFADFEKLSAMTPADIPKRLGLSVY